ncbi:hypothetical protein SAMN05443248_2354 [Bradyrhizobium erythrophlei]|jgi:hypothetical protein|uniref:Uncharacterized protein n=1 Tax=Bradyrhizobium erythrophlei TaxID=1437360 RepID=A0A1M5LT91_9BRAD|nr:hypothetical protein SAMN05443248_2354 [Bradyrhizobium erythrophlei]
MGLAGPAEPEFGKAPGLIRPHVTDARECAMTAGPAAVGSAASRASPGRVLGDGGGFSRSTIRHRRRPGAGTAAAPRARDLRCYLTSFSSGGRCGPCRDCGSCELSSSSANISSHSAFNSESPMRLIFIRSPRTATDNNCALSRLPLSIRTVRHCSRVARTDCNRCSGLATSVFSVTELARQSGGDPVRRFIYLSIKSAYFRNGAMDLVGRDVVEGVTG